MDLAHDLGRSGSLLVFDPRTRSRHPFRNYLNVVILCTVNIVNYSDRYTLATVLPAMQSEMQMKNDVAGALQSVTILFYTAAAPIWGFVGDRFNRNLSMVISLLIWTTAHLAFSFLNKTWSLMLMRGVFGIGQAGFTTVAPSLIGDLFQGNDRTRVLVLFYLGIPVGQGMGYIIGTQMNEALHSWRWALRVTPAFTLVLALVIVLWLEEPPRLVVDGKAMDTEAGSTYSQHSHWVKDVVYLAKNASYVCLTFAFLCVAFVSGAFFWWAPKIYVLGFGIDPDDAAQSTKDRSNRILTSLGFLAMGCGVMGLFVAYVMGYGLKRRCPILDPLISGVGMVLSVPFQVGSMYATSQHFAVCFFILGLGLVLSNINWAISTDVMLYVVVPSRRSMAMGILIFVGHLLGDCISPYLMGLMSTALQNTFGGENAKDSEFKALRRSFDIVSVFGVLAGVCFFVCCCFVERDMKKASVYDFDEEDN